MGDTLGDFVGLRDGLVVGLGVQALQCPGQVTRMSCGQPNWAVKFAHTGGSGP